MNQKNQSIDVSALKSKTRIGAASARCPRSVNHSPRPIQTELSAICRQLSAKPGLQYVLAKSIGEIRACTRATTRVAATNSNARRDGLRLHAWDPRPPGGGDGGFSTLFRSALKQIGDGYVRRAQSPVHATAEIRGKTGPVPNGAVLFGPFSLARKKKGVKNEKTIRWEGNFHTDPEQDVPFEALGCYTY